MVRRTRGISRSEFLRLSGAGLAGATLLGVAGCGGGQQGGGEVVRFFTGTAETTSQERANIEIQVYGFQEQYPKYTLEREAIPPDEVRTVIKTHEHRGGRLRRVDPSRRRLPRPRAPRRQQPRPPRDRTHKIRPIFEALRDTGFDGYMAMECAVRGDAKTVLPQVVSHLRSLMGEGGETP